jgi:hypothetical protein
VDATSYVMRAACRFCGSTQGRIQTKNGQDCVYCRCDTFQYNAPGLETGREPRTVSTVHDGVSASQRWRILDRATARCESCGARGNLHVAHLISVKAGLEHGLTERELNADENLAAFCDECNLGMADTVASLRLAIVMLRARAERLGHATHSDGIPF